MKHSPNIIRASIAFGRKESLFRLKFPNVQNLSAISSSSQWHHHLTKRNAVTATERTNDNSNDDIIMLYQRDLGRNKVPRSAFVFSILNTTYWMWYALDFIPAVNASPIEDLHIDPMIGVGGVAFALLINGITGLYPSSLVSKLAYSQSSKSLLLWGHDLPLIQQSMEPTEYPLGRISVDRKTADAQNLLKDPRTYRGHLPLKVPGKRIPLLMEIREPGKELFLAKTKYSESEKQSLLLLQSLMDPQAVLKSKKMKIGAKKKRGVGPKRRKQRL